MSLQSICRSIFQKNLPGETGPQIAERCADAGAFVAIPHPEWCALTQEDAASDPCAHAVEVYNHTSQVRGGGACYLDDLLNSGRRINRVRRLVPPAYARTRPASDLIVNVDRPLGLT